MEQKKKTGFYIRNIEQIFQHKKDKTYREGSHRQNKKKIHILFYCKTYSDKTSFQ